MLYMTRQYSELQILDSTGKLQSTINEGQSGVREF